MCHLLLMLELVRIGMKPINSADIKLESSWKTRLLPEFEKPYMQELKAFLIAQKNQGIQILPAANLWFNAFNTTPYDAVKVVILGQDPYPTPGHAHGLCFSVLPEVQPLPKSLINIYKELKDDLGIENKHGYLQSWAEQGVLLLNTILTVIAGNAKSHKDKGWEVFTNVVIETLNQSRQPIAFVLWGSDAGKKAAMIDTSRHLVISSVHPSPLSAYRGFFGSKPFSKINKFLQQHNRSIIDWQV